MNTYFCGSDYFEAETNCSLETACAPGSAGCSAGFTCYTGIQCAATAALNPVVAPTPTVVSQPMGGSAPTVLNAGTTPGPTTVLQGLFGNTSNENFNAGNSGTSTGGAAPPLNKFCGTDSNNAKLMCATAIPCPDGLSNSCLQGQSCFPLMEPCAAGTNDVNAIFQPGQTQGQPQQNPTQFINRPTLQPIQKIPFDPSITMYCGADYDDARDNCFMRTPCPNGAASECPAGTTCFTVNNCMTPAPTPSKPPARAGDTKMPTTPQTDVGFSWEPPDGSAGMVGCGGLMLKSIALGGVILAAVVL